MYIHYTQYLFVWCNGAFEYDIAIAYRNSLFVLIRGPKHETIDKLLYNMIKVCVESLHFKFVGFYVCHED